MARNTKPILPCTAPSGECICSPIQWNKAINPLIRVSNADMVNQRIIGVRFHKRPIHDFQLKWRYKCNNMAAKNRQPKIT